MDVDPRHYTFARATQPHIEEVIRGGRTIVKNRKLPGIDLEAVHETLRAQNIAIPSARLNMCAAPLKRLSP
nr:hypothetical protein [Marinicella sp. W31]MDC2879254.1 hypothetical protein [Marinicella sp. W31]